MSCSRSLALLNWASERAKALQPPSCGRLRHFALKPAAKDWDTRHVHILAEVRGRERSLPRRHDAKLTKGTGCGAHDAQRVQPLAVPGRGVAGRYEPLRSMRASVARGRGSEMARVRGGRLAEERPCGARPHHTYGRNACLSRRVVAVDTEGSARITERCGPPTSRPRPKDARQTPLGRCYPAGRARCGARTAVATNCTRPRTMKGCGVAIRPPRDTDATGGAGATDAQTHGA